MITEMKSSSPAWIGVIRRRWGLWVVLAVALLMAGVRLRLLDFPLERDEGEYAYAGQLILQGISPYQLAYNMKFPGTYGAYALIMAAFGETKEGIHLGVLCVTTLTTLLLFGLGRRLLDDTAGVVAATTYALLAASPAMLGLQGHATHFAAACATAGLFVLWPARANTGAWRALAGGVLFGLALLMKQHAAVFCAWAAVFLAAPLLRRRTISLADRLKYAAGLGGGMLLPFGLTCLILWRAGVLKKFWFWTVTYASEYAFNTPLAEAPARFGEGLTAATMGNTGLWLVAVAGLGLIWFDDRLRQTRLALFGLFLAALLSTVPGFHFRQHYFLLLLPAVALLAGCAVSTTGLKWRRLHRLPLPRAWPLGAYAALAGLTLYLNYGLWFQLPMVRVAHLVYYPSSPLLETETFADVIRTNSAPEARVAVLGSEPEIYFLSRRHSATGYIYTYPLMEDQPFARQMQDEMIREIEAAKPEFVVLMVLPWSWLLHPASNDRILDWWTQIYQTNYLPVGLAELKEDQPTRYVWGPDVGRSPVPENGLLLYQRRR